MPIRHIDSEAPDTRHLLSSVECKTGYLGVTTTAARTLLTGVLNSNGTVTVDVFEVEVELEGSQPDLNFLVFQKRGLKPEDRWVTHLVADSTGSGPEEVRVLAGAVAAETVPVYVGTGPFNLASGTLRSQEVRNA